MAIRRKQKGMKSGQKRVLGEKENNTNLLTNAGKDNYHSKDNVSKVTNGRIKLDELLKKSL